MSLLSHLSFVQCEQVKLRPKKKVKIKVSHSAVTVGTVGWGERAKAIKHNKNFCNVFNLISFTISNKV